MHLFRYLPRRLCPRNGCFMQKNNAPPFALDISHLRCRNTGVKAAFLHAWLRRLIHGLVSQELLVVVLGLSLGVSSVAADDGIQTKICKTCNQPPKHGGLLSKDTRQLTVPAGKYPNAQSAIDSLNQKIGDTFWAPAVHAYYNYEYWQYPYKVVIENITAAPYTGSENNYYGWNITYTYNIYQYEIPYSDIPYDLQDTGATDFFGKEIFFIFYDSYIDWDFYKCTGVSWLDESSGIPIGAKMARSPAGHPGETKVQPPSLSNAGADPSGSSGGCSSCSQAEGAPGVFKLAINLGNNGTEDVLWNFSGSLAQADLLTSASFTAYTELGYYPGSVVTVVPGKTLPQTVVVSNVQSSPPRTVATTTFDYSYNATHTNQLDSLRITVTPEDSTQPVITHTFTRVPPTDGTAMQGVRYMRAVTGGSTESMAFYNLGASGTVANSNRIEGVFRTVNTAGDTETLTALPQTSSPYNWVTSSTKPNGGYFSGTYQEIDELDPADPSQPTVTTLRTYRKIGTAAKNRTVLVSEHVTQAGVSTTTLYGYDETRSFTDTTNGTLYDNSNFGAQMWAVNSDGNWHLTVLEKIPHPDYSGQTVYGDSITFEPWQNGPNSTPDLTADGAAQTFFSSLISTARSSNYAIGGCKRTRTTDATVQTGLYVDWQTRTTTSICLEGGSTIDLGTEYSYGVGDEWYSETVSAHSFGLDGYFTRQSRSERWNAAGTAEQWSESFATQDQKQTLSVDQTGVAQVTVTNEQSDGSFSQDAKRVLTIPYTDDGSMPLTPTSLFTDVGHSLWSTTTTDSEGRTVSETSRFGESGTAIQTISTNYTSDGGYTRSANGVTLSSSSTDAQGVTTNSNTGSDGSTTTTTTQSAGGTTRKLSVTVADALGRTTSNTDANGGTTTYDYTNTPQVHSVTEHLPGGGLRITDTYLDGQLKSITGTAVTPEYHYYSVNAGGGGYEAGSITETVYYGTDNGDAWRKTTTNFLGQTLREETPAPPGVGGVSVTVHTYNAKGQRVNTSSPGMADLIIGYDIWGQVNQQGYDMNASGTLTAGSTDILTTSSTNYAAGEGTVLETVVRAQYTQDGTNTTLQTKTERKLLEGALWQRTTQADGTVLLQSDSITGTTRTVTTQQSVTGSQTQKQVYENGLLTKETPLGTTSEIKYYYNDFGQLAHVDHPINGTTTFTYAPLTGNLHTQGQSGGDTATYVTNTRGLVDSVEHTDLTKTNYTYDDQGHTLTESGSAGYPLRYEYNSMGRLWKLHTYRSGILGGITEGDVTTWNYDPASGVLLSKTDALGRSVTYTYDAAGRVRTRAWQRGITTTYGYDGAGRRTSIDYSDSTPDVSLTYDRAGRRATTTDAAGAHTLTYDDTPTGGGQPATWSVTGSSAWSGLSVVYGKNAGRRTSRATSIGGISLPSAGYTYTASGRMDTVSSGGITATYRYRESTGWNDGVDYTGGLRSTRMPDALGRLDPITWTLGGATLSGHDYTINALNRRSDALRQDGSSWHYNYNDRGEVNSAAKKNAANVYEPGKQYAFTYDGIGNRTSSGVSSIANATVFHTTGYNTTNSLNQYSGSDSAITHPGSFVLRGRANTDSTVHVSVDGGTPLPRTGELWVYEGSVINTAGPVNRVVEIAASGVDANRNNAPVNTKRKGVLFIPPASETPVYDADGNLTSDARWDYTWDGENHLIAQVEKTGIPTVVAPGISMPAATTRTRLEFSYDAQGRRISKRVYTATNGGSFVLQQSLVFLYDGWNMIAEIDSSSGTLLRSYEWGTDMSGTLSGAGGVGGLLVVRSHAGAASGTYAPCYDGNGNVTELVNLANGRLSARYEYGAFGETISVDGGAVAGVNPFRFSTKYLDMETGLYNYGYRYYDAVNGRWLNRDPIAERGGINLYGMVGNDPVNRWDYLGLRDLSSQELLTISELRSRAGGVKGVNPKLAEALEATASDFESLIKELPGSGDPTYVNVLNAAFKIWTTPELANLYNSDKNNDRFMCSAFVKRSLFKGGVTGFGEPTAGQFTNGGDMINKVNMKIIYSMQYATSMGVKVDLKERTIFHAEVLINAQNPKMGDIVSYGKTGTTASNSSHIGIYLGHGIFLNATAAAEPNAFGIGFLNDSGSSTGNVMIKFLPETLEPEQKMIFRSVK